MTRWPRWNDDPRPPGYPAQLTDLYRDLCRTWPEWPSSPRKPPGYPPRLSKPGGPQLETLRRKCVRTGPGKFSLPGTTFRMRLR